MIVWRVEDERGEGPYYAGAMPSESYTGDASHPDPRKDGIKEFKEGTHRSGFASVEAAWKWFHPYLEDLKGCGFLLTTYECPDHDVRLGGTQLVFTEGEPMTVEPIEALGIYIGPLNPLRTGAAERG